MKDDEWGTTERVFQAALLALPEDREAIIRRESGGDRVLAHRVRALLHAHAHTGVVDRLADELAAPLAAAFSRTPDEGRRVGPYAIRELLGRGGMGNVYLADRVDGEFEQQVALKLVREGVNSEAVRARFRTERQLLARLHHPNIARLLDGGIDGDGRPYFAMEVVEGVRLDRYCDDGELPVRQRLELFTQVCEAVQYAHQNLIIHRDLKPANILVRETDGVPHVMLMDFGIARLLEAEGDNQTDVTMTRAMTPEYAAPEQLRGEAITTRTDVYALGVVLYELLAGRRPHSVRGLSLAEAERTICDTVPAAPSKAVVEQSEGTPNTAELSRSLAGDLDTIALKALSKEPERRYASAEALSEDIRRFLAGLPVNARPDSFQYRAAKFVRRNRGGVMAAATILLLLIAGLGGVLWQNGRARFERDRAINEARKAEESLGLLVDLFEQADPGQTEGERVTARSVLDQAASRVARLPGDSEVRSVLMDAIGRVFYNLGLYSGADSLFAEALGFGGSDKAVGAARARLLVHYGKVKAAVGAFEDSDSLTAEAITILRNERPANPELALALHEHAATLRALGRVDEAEVEARESLSLKEQMGPGNQADRAATVYLLATLEHDRGNFDAGENLFRRSIELFRRDSLALTPVAADASEALGQFLQYRGDYDGARPLLEDALSIRRKLYGDVHPEVLSSQSSLGSLLYQLGETAAAEELLEPVVAFGDEHPGVAGLAVIGAKHVFGLVRFNQARFDEAAQLLQGVADGYEIEFGPENGLVLAVRNHLGRAQLRAHDLSAAERTFVSTEAAVRRALGEQHPYVASAVHGQGSVARMRGDRVAAERLYREALDIYRKSLKEENDLLSIVKQDLGSLLVELGRSDEAVPMLREAITSFEKRYPADHFYVLNTESYLAEALANTGKREEGLAVADSSYLRLAERYGPDNPNTVAAADRLRRIRAMISTHQ